LVSGLTFGKLPNQALASAAFANLQTGDLIEEVDRQPVATVDDLRKPPMKSKETVLQRHI
jgi:S1-C subfamily serine protease